jgi:hypothetical protein
MTTILKGKRDAKHRFTVFIRDGQYPDLEIKCNTPFADWVKE